MIVALSSVGGAPGVSSWCVLLAAAWPVDTDARVVLEADVSGGVFGARYGLGVDPGVVSLIAGLRRSKDGGVDLDEHARLLAPSVWLIPGPESAEQATKVWSGSTGNVADCAAADSGVWFVDCGRGPVRGGDTEFVRNAVLSIVMSRAESEHLVQVPSRVADLRKVGGRVAVLVIGKPGHGTDELGAFFGSDRTWVVGETSELVALTAAVLHGGRARRSWLWRSALDVAASVCEEISTSSADPATAGDVA
ncbi:MAG: hypothetical protein JWL72_1413 [Ilumatobacteraceae bacterium]|nr:hypothetical protein [Ilumatobacteraceae bacterium]MCU1388075.1 hypothetical protein [Ilumatobacteraceae bacterium]